MGRKRRYETRPTHHPCDCCNELQPFDEQHYQVSHNSVWRLRFTCRKCTGATYDPRRYDHYQETQKQEAQLGKDHRYCRKCGGRLSIYNNTGECWSHSVVNKNRNANWEPRYSYVPKYTL